MLQPGDTIHMEQTAKYMFLSKGQSINYREGGYKIRGAKFNPYKKRGWKQVLAMLKRGVHKTFWSSFNTSA